jgi:hypothetical protein
MLTPNRKLAILAVPLWWLAKPVPPGVAIERRILDRIFRDMPPDTVFIGQSVLNIYTQTHDYVVTHPSFDEVGEGGELPIRRPTWMNVRAALLYGDA